MSFAKNSDWVEGAAPGISAARLQHIEDQAALFCVPSGGIIMWSGLIANIPTGWYICDGNNGTPNLLGRFVEGVATAATNPGTTGGSTSKTTVGHYHAPTTGGGGDGFTTGTRTQQTDTKTDSIADIRPLYFDLAFLMKS